MRLPLETNYRLLGTLESRLSSIDGLSAGEITRPKRPLILGIATESSQTRYEPLDHFKAPSKSEPTSIVFHHASVKDSPPPLPLSINATLALNLDRGLMPG